MGICILLLIGLIVLRSQTYEAMDEAVSLVMSDRVKSIQNTYVFEPTTDAVANIILYQGGLVQTESYAILANKISEKGYRVFLPKLPLNLAILQTNRHKAILNDFPSDAPWWLAGHSLGGVSALRALKKDEALFEGGILLASYGTDATDLSSSNLRILSITADNDTVFNWTSFENYQTKLPENTLFLTIEGGNHSGFGHYGNQKGDGPMTISREVQQALVAESIDDFIQGLE